MALRARLFPVLTSVVVAAAFTVSANTVHAQDWEQRKTERFRPITPAEEMRMVDAAPSEATVKPAAPRRVLVFYRCEGFIHTSIPMGNRATEVMGRKTGAFETDLADTYDVFTAENLSRYDVVVLNNTTHLAFPEAEMEAALLDFVASGKGVVGYHAATDNFYKHPKAAAMMGGQFNGHPWNAGGTWAFQLDDPNHKLNRAFDASGFWHTDEIYQYRPDSYQGPEVLRLLVSLDMSKETVAKQRRDDDPGGYPPGPREVPVSWVRSFGEGRVFVTNLGHREETFWKPEVLQHMFDGIQFAAGDLEVDTKPTAEVETEAPAPAPER